MGDTLTRFIVSAFLAAVLCAGAVAPVAGQNAPAPLSAHETTAKLAPALRQLKSKGKRQVRVQVTDVPSFTKWLSKTLPTAQLLQVDSASRTTLLSNLHSKDYLALTQCPWVTFVDVANREAREEAHLQNADLTVNNVEALHLRFPHLTGVGLVASVKENQFDSADIDFKHRVIPSAGLTGVANPHATTMATLIGGGGNSSPAGKGVAWQSTLTASDFANLMPDNLNQLKTLGVTVQNHSYGVGVENYYGLESQAYDRQVLQYPELLHVFSSGNAGNQAAADGPYAALTGFANLTGQFKVSKNTLTVGAIDTAGQVGLLSSRGPTYDGRIKPEVVAFGESGTSEAAAVVSGIALLVQQAYQKQQGGHLPPSHLVKAAILNAADDKGSPEVDYAAGFGNADALGAVQAVQENRFVLGKVGQGQVQKIPVLVPAGTSRLKATLVWHEVEGLPNAPAALLNDLDLKLTSPATGQEWLPWGLSTFPHKDSLLLPARRQVDRLNNVEQITLALPEAGPYELHVTGFGVNAGDQDFSVVYEFEQRFAWAYPTAGSPLRSDEKNRLRWHQPINTGEKGRLEFRWAGTAPGRWQVLQERVDLAKEQLDWTAPADTAGLAELRMVIGAEVFATGTVVVSPVLQMQVGYQCGEEVMLFWPKAEGAEQYQVYSLGEKFLEPLVQTADTMVVLSKNTNGSLYYAVSPLVAGLNGQRSLTLHYAQQGVSCYIKNFLAQRFVTDTVLLNLELSTTYGVAALFLEKKVGSEFRTLSEIPLSRQVGYVLQDLEPAPGRNEYRIKVVTSTGQTFYSPTEAVVFAPAKYIQVFPNPIKAGNELSLITHDDQKSQILVYDHLGRLLRQTHQDGAVKSLSTAGLSAGLYMVRVVSAQGQLLQARVVVF
ncbi:S8 family serine peptidase [Rufibacter ruber]|uniref:S8 family serine peptidase n=1 Tax=Rufibacter ruber TaxID=1783499 RepID=UPI0009ED7AF8|nr:S8 family serine peptidase [Rufibacter ruber]